MPFRITVPLPGPISYSRPLRRQTPGHGGMWWLLVGLWYVPIRWTAYALTWLVLATCRVTVLGYRAIRLAAHTQHQDRQHTHHNH